MFRDWLEGGSSQMFTLNKPSLKNGLTNHKKCMFIVLKEGAYLTQTNIYLLSKSRCILGYSNRQK
jgi:hypothetical protein